MSGRRITTAVTLTVLVVVLCAMAVYGFKAATAPLPGATAKQPTTCSSAETQVKTTLARGNVQVSVYNAGTRSGLASTTLDKVEAAGFVAGNSGNAPAGSKVRRVLVRTTKADDPAAQLVALAFGRKTPIEVSETDLGPGVDVLVGNRFTSLDPKAPRKVKLPQPEKTCVPVK